jgi:hypothetical protein
MVFVTKNGKVVAITADILGLWFLKNFLYLFIFTATNNYRCFKTGSGSFELYRVGSFLWRYTKVTLKLV